MSGPDFIALAVFLVLIGLIAFVGFRIVEPRAELKDESAGNPYPRILEQRDLALVTRQLRAVIGGSFEKQRLLNKSELRVFNVVEQDVAAARTGHRVFAQVCLGEILQSQNRDAFFAINSKRVDMLIVDDAGWPVVAVEFQGKGHFQGTAEARDAIKYEAFRKSGISYVEIFADDSEDQIRSRVREQLGWNDTPVTHQKLSRPA